jgi:hypothetical protein
MRFAIGGRPASPARGLGGPDRSRSPYRSTLAANLPVNSAQAHFRSERGTNENTNGLTSEYLQKGTEVSGDIDYLWAVADSRIQETKRSVHEADACAAGIQLVAG